MKQRKQVGFYAVFEKTVFELEMCYVTILSSAAELRP